MMSRHESPPLQHAERSTFPLPSRVQPRSPTHCGTSASTRRTWSMWHLLSTRSGPYTLSSQCHLFKDPGSSPYRVFLQQTPDLAAAGPRDSGPRGHSGERERDICTELCGTQKVPLSFQGGCVNLLSWPPVVLSLRAKGGLSCLQEQVEAGDISYLQFSLSFLAMLPRSPTPKVRDVSLGITCQLFGGH